MRVVIVGGSHAGIACALRAREEYPDADIVLYEKQDAIGFVAQSIPLYLQGSPSFDKIRSYTSATALEAKGITVRTGMVVRRVDTDAKQIIFVPAAGDDLDIDSYDKLVIATGSYPSIPLAAGDYRDKLLVVKTYSDAVRIKELMSTARTVIVIGGGAIGIEMTRGLIDAGIHPVLLQAPAALLDRYLDDDAAAAIRAGLEQEGVEIHTSSLVTQITADTAEGGRNITVVTQAGETYTADGIIYCTGFRPNTVLVGGQVELGEMGAIVVDDYMRTSEPDVFAVGDCSTTTLKHVIVPTYVPHASDAFRQGEIAAVNLMGPRRKLNSSQGTYSLNFGDHTLAMTGLSLKRALSEGFDAAVAYTRNNYIDSDRFYEARLVYEKGSHLILGISVRGTVYEISGVADLYSLAIEQDLTVDDMEYSDFFFKHGFHNPFGLPNILADVIRNEERGQAGEPGAGRHSFGAQTVDSQDVAAARDAATSDGDKGTAL
ncbi:MAG: FAD-dependent oxidoreductase [Cellulomonadaceae bacterium]|jgi:NADPH-dependent 2,4-dienoyl-CoA reductase/sulfur reductase-like enzyme|nr:FAD-dependent oxidoreductase [Cellulomonadaceae bacterium]